MFGGDIYWHSIFWNLTNMKIVTWNCNGAFRKKFREVEKLNADIYIIQECENPEFVDGEFKEWAANYRWIGTNKNRGLAIFVNSEISLINLDWASNNLELFLPVRINNSFNLIGVWTKQANSPTFAYIGQLWKYLSLHKSKFAEPTILCGDFNSNKIWDVWDRWWNHSDVVRELEQVNMSSLYHRATGELQGEESKPTFFLQKKLEKPYHIDYAFATDDLFDCNENVVELFSPQEWLKFSDHIPLVFTINARKN